MTAITFPLKPITAIKFSASVKHSHKEPLVSIETPSHWCLSSSSGEAGGCPRAPLPSYFILCDLTKSNKSNSELCIYTVKEKRKSQLGGSEGSLAFQPSTEPLLLILSLAEEEQEAAPLSAERRQRFPLLASKRSGAKAVMQPGLDDIRTAAGSGLTVSSCPQQQSTILSVLHIKMDAIFRPGISNHKPAAQLQVKVVMTAKVSKLRPKLKLCIKFKMNLGLHPFLPRGKKIQ